MEATVISGGAITVTFAVASAMKGVALAWIVAEPLATPLTTIATLVAPAANVTVGGTVATAELLELRLIVKPPAGAGPERFNPMFCVEPLTMFRVCWEKLTVAVTWTGWLLET